MPYNEFNAAKGCSRRLRHHAGRKKTMRNPRPWVIVENPGTDVEDVYSDHETFADAQRALKNAPEGCDIMKRLDDGTLTTEF